MKARSFELVASAIAAILLSFGGYMLWRTSSAEPEWAGWQRAWSAALGNSGSPRLREVGVAWRCVRSDAGACKSVSEVERCTSCHLGGLPDGPRVLREHPHRRILIDRHADLGCVACHGGDGLAATRATAHEGLAALDGDIQARCAMCHDDTRPTSSSGAREVWARWLATRDGKPPPEPHPKESAEPDLASWVTRGREAFRSLRCGACHAASEQSPIATPLELLASRSTPAELAFALANHATRTGVDLMLDPASAASVVGRLRSIEAPDAATSVHRASVPGSSADEGRVLEAGLGCVVACHDASTHDDGRLHLGLAPIVSTRTPDWIAYFLADPARANPASTMPSLRLSPREASSLAQHLVKEAAAARATDATHGAGVDATGTAIIAASKCAACHTLKLAPGAMALTTYGDTHDGASAAAKLSSHVGYHLDDDTKRSLSLYLVSQVSTRVREDLHVGGREGATVFRSLGCAGCHADDASTAGAPTLFGEGLRVRPQWLFELLRAPERHPIRPPLHPEWAYRELVPAERVTLRMPTFRLTDDQVTALVRFFAERDGASFPYVGSPPIAIVGEALTSAIGDVTRKDRGACMSCHTITTPDVSRAREEADKLAPPLALAHDRLRPDWIEACIMQPDHWVPHMPAFVRPIAEVDRVRDLVLLVRDRTVLPAAGAEGVIPALGLGDVP